MCDLIALRRGVTRERSINDPNHGCWIIGFAAALSLLQSASVPLQMLMLLLLIDPLLLLLLLMLVDLLLINPNR